MYTYIHMHIHKHKHINLGAACRFAPPSSGGSKTRSIRKARIRKLRIVDSKIMGNIPVDLGIPPL